MLLARLLKNSFGAHETDPAMSGMCLSSGFVSTHPQRLRYAIAPRDLIGPYQRLLSFDPHDH